MSNVIWEKLRNEIGKDSVEIHTIKRNGDIGLWFKVMVDKGRVIVDKAETKLPSIEITQPRKIKLDEFERISKLYEKWMSGEIQRNEIRNSSMNTSYIFGIMNWFS